jgi:hypothetical protein
MKEEAKARKRIVTERHGTSVHTWPGKFTLKLLSDFVVPYMSPKQAAIGSNPSPEPTHDPSLPRPINTAPSSLAVAVRIRANPINASTRHGAAGVDGGSRPRDPPPRPT